jgi:Nucleotidyltransferase domain
VIAEAQLITWSSQGPTGQFTDTYQRIRDNLLDKSTPYPLKDTKVFLQGSYRNDTNVYGDSDVDIVLYHTGAFYKDVSRLSVADRQAYDTAHAGVVQYAYGDFKRDTISYISRLYNKVHAGKKALYIPGNDNRRSADVLIASEFRRYYEFKSLQNQRYAEGVCFFPAGGAMIENFPKPHFDNCTAKHQATNGWFKHTVRIFKNMRNTMIAKGLLADGAVPSYFIEGMLYNVPMTSLAGAIKAPGRTALTPS